MFFRNQVEKFVKTPFTESLIKVLGKHMHNNQDNKDAISYAC